MTKQMPIWLCSTTKTPQHKAQIPVLLKGLRAVEPRPCYQQLSTSCDHRYQKDSIRSFCLTKLECQAKYYNQGARTLADLNPGDTSECIMDPTKLKIRNYPRPQSRPKSAHGPMKLLLRLAKPFAEVVFISGILPSSFPHSSLLHQQTERPLCLCNRQAKTKLSHRQNLVLLPKQLQR